MPFFTTSLAISNTSRVSGATINPVPFGEQGRVVLGDLFVDFDGPLPDHRVTERVLVVRGGRRRAAIVESRFVGLMAAAALKEAANSLPLTELEALVVPLRDAVDRLLEFQNPRDSQLLRELRAVSERVASS
jgi:hypothetical protein